MKNPPDADRKYRSDKAAPAQSVLTHDRRRTDWMLSPSSHTPPGL